MTARHLFLIVFLSIAVVGCSLDDRTQNAPSPTADTAMGGANEAGKDGGKDGGDTDAVLDGILGRIGSLGKTVLPDGSCGLFLWARIANSRVLVASVRNDRSGVTMKLDETEMLFRQTLGEGRAFYGIQEKIYFKGADIIGELSLDATSANAVTNGATIKRASILITDDTGTALSLPVAGLIACQQTKK